MINLTLLLYKIIIDITFIIYQSQSINYLVKKNVVKLTIALNLLVN